MPPVEELAAGLSVAVIGIICLSFVGMTVLTIVSIIVIRRFIQKKVGLDRTVLEQGIAAKAKIISVQQTNMLVNYQPQAVFQLEVYPPNGEPYQATTKTVISMVNIPQYQPGAEISVKIHPVDRTKVEIDWLGGIKQS
jgi:hypothetical protein